MVSGMWLGVELRSWNPEIFEEAGSRQREQARIFGGATAGERSISSGMTRKSTVLGWLVLAALTRVCGGAPEVTAQPTDGGVRILIDGQVFTEYVGKGAQRPYLYPLTGPSGANLARPYPMEKGGAEDHPHHRSFWFAHGSVNGIDFWADGDKHGRQEHRGVTGVEAAGSRAAFLASTEWVSASGETVLTDERKIVVEAGEDGARRVDFAITLKASHGEVVFGDTKEGTFALRVCPSLSHEGEGAQGRMVSSEGKKNGAVWGKPAKWVSYFGPDPKGEAVTVSILDHPANLRHPTWWHARTYGLFAANPFGKHDFEKLEDKTAGNHKLNAGESLTLRYRVVIRPGEPDEALLGKEFAAFGEALAR